MRLDRRVDFALYLQAFAVYARNAGVLLFPLLAALVALGLDYASGWLFAAVGGAGYPIIAFIIQMLYGFAFAIAVIFADDAWRHGRASLAAAWSQARQKAGNILLAVLGFFFLVYVAQLIGGMLGGPLADYASKLLGAIAVWAFIYAIPAAAIGGVPGSAVFSASLQAARRNPLATVVLTIVALVLFQFVISPYWETTNLWGPILVPISFGYIALIVARQYSDLAFRPYW